LRELWQVLSAVLMIDFTIKRLHHFAIVPARHIDTRVLGYINKGGGMDLLPLLGVHKIVGTSCLCGLLFAMFDNQSWNTRHTHVPQAYRPRRGHIGGIGRGMNAGLMSLSHADSKNGPLSKVTVFDESQGNVIGIMSYVTILQMIKWRAKCWGTERKRSSCGLGCTLNHLFIDNEQ